MSRSVEKKPLLMQYYIVLLSYMVVYLNYIYKDTDMVKV